MKNRFGIVIILCCFLFTACSNQTVHNTDSTNLNIEKPLESTEQPEEDDSTSNENNTDNPIKLTSKSYSYEKEHIHYQVTYPQFENDAYGLNEKITAFAMQTVDEFGFEAPLYNEEYDYYEERTIQEDYEIKSETSEILSIAITGYFDIKGTAHPSYTARSLNLDLKTGQVINIEDRITIDEQFVEKLLASAKEQLPETLYDAIETKDKDLLLAYCKKADTIYLATDGIGIYCETIYALGGYVEIKIRTETDS